MFRIGEEPISGYRLEEFLGRGGFGSVWRASAPGGTSAALKLIDLQGHEGLKEFRGIQRVKQIRHPNLMPVTALWMLDNEGQVLDDAAIAKFAAVGAGASALEPPGSSEVLRPATLVVAMLLGEQNLQQRLVQCQEAGQAGIPAGELLGYMEDAAKAIDFLNSLRHEVNGEKVAVQHGDIKPPNIMLLGGAALVCDFGLARLVGRRATQSIMSGSPAYMAPECFQGNTPARTSDQYSLAISYVELRTGSLPIEADIPMAVMHAHLQGDLDLSRLPPAEQKVTHRATALDPSQRFHNCTEMVTALREAAVSGQTVTTTPPPRLKSSSTANTAAIQGSHVQTRSPRKPLTSHAGVGWKTLAANRAMQIAATSIVVLALIVVLLLTWPSGDNDQQSAPPVRQPPGNSQRSADLESKDQSATISQILERPAQCVISFNPPDAQVTINGEKRQLIDGALSVKMDRPLDIAATRKGFRDLRQTTTAEELRSQSGELEVILPIQSESLTPPPDAVSPQKAAQHICLVVLHKLKSDHLHKRPLDDQLVRHAIVNLIRQLDPMKLYLRQTDVDDLTARADSLTAELTEGNLGTLFKFDSKYVSRVHDSAQLAEKWLNQMHDFTTKEELLVDLDQRQFAVTDADADELWRKQIKYELLLAESKGISAGDARLRIARRYRSLYERLISRSHDQVMELAVNAIANAYDPHTKYMSPERLEKVRSESKMSVAGIGVVTVVKDGFPTIAQVVAKSPANLEGLKVGDEIVAVGQGDGGRLDDVTDVKEEDVEAQLRGATNSLVKLEVRPRNSSKTTVHRLVRAPTPADDSDARGQVVDHNMKGFSASRVGIVDLRSFYVDMEAVRNNAPNYRSATRDVRLILEDFRKQDVHVVVLDLRRNKGGSLNEAISLTGLFIDKGPVVQVRDSDRKTVTYDDLKRGAEWDGPLVVLTSKSSAAAAEICAGAIQDYRRGILLGDRHTYGSGTVQTVSDLGKELFRIDDPPKLGALALTVQQHYRANGESTQKRGVLVDIELPSLTNEMEIGEQTLNGAIEFDRLPQAEYDKLNFVSSRVIVQLRQRSQERIAKSPGFQQLLAAIERQRTFSSRRFVSLNQQEFRKAIVAVPDSTPLSEHTFMETGDDFYSNEVLNIAADYAAMADNMRDPRNSTATPKADSAANVSPTRSR